MLKKIHALALSFLYAFPLITYAHTDFATFAKSFIDGYAFNPEGRFTREYHPYILSKTQASLQQLENYLTQHTFAIDHRVLIMGYEHNAVPHYFDCLSHAQICDEAVTKTNSGWEFAAANLFGLLTGYLFKDAGAQRTALVQHIQADDVELFAPNTEIVREHALGQWHNFVSAYQSGMQQHVRIGDMSAIFRYLINFWQSLYEAESKNSQAKTIATQDILFSLYYVKHLAQSPIAVKTLFVGPDLTYPIETTEAQPAAVTRNAQVFVKRFVQELQPIQNEKTAYVFWSFVDGVGKSTLLGNIINWQQHGAQFDKYQHFSNASSQRATLYQYSDNVIIADLPAQVSHYCAKPEGSVYIDLGFSTLSKKDKSDLYTHIQAHQHELRAQFNKKQEQLRAGGTIETIEDHVVNIAIQCNKHPCWCPCLIADKHVVFNIHDARQIRLLVPFDQAHSQGLKIKEPELMIFDRGLAMPMRYEHFMHDLTNQLTKAGVKHLVLIDFLGMYTRTSRETVRINYFVQQLKEFYHDDFDLPHSTYNNFAHQHELYPLFTDYKDQLERNLYLETLLRWVVYGTIINNSGTDIQNLSSIRVHEQLRTAINDLQKNHAPELNEVLTRSRIRIEQEIATISHYQYSAFYEAVSRFSVTRFAQLAELVRSLTAQYHPQDTIRDLWTQLEAPIASFAQDRRTCTLKNGLKLNVIRSLKAYELDQALVTTLSEQARRMWYEHIVGLIVPEMYESYKEALLVKKDENDTYYLLFYQHEPLSEQAPALLYELAQFGMSKDEASKVSYARQWVEKIIRTQYQQQYGQEAAALFVPLEKFCDELDTNNLWGTLLAEPRDMRAPQPVQINYQTVQVVIQALATLHMNLKSPRDKLMVRYGNQQDFVCALRIWHDVMLSKYLNISLRQPLFTDFAEIKPLVGALRERTNT